MEETKVKNKPSMLTRILMIVGGLVLLCVLFFAFTFGVAWVATSGIADAGNAFMTALQNNDMDAAYAMFTPELKDEVSPDEFREMFASNVFGDDSLESWSFNSRNIENNIGQVHGSATIGERTFDVTLGFVKDGEWLIDGYDFTPQS